MAFPESLDWKEWVAWAIAWGITSSEHPVLWTIVYLVIFGGILIGGGLYAFWPRRVKETILPPPPAEFFEAGEKSAKPGEIPRILD